MSLKEFRQGLLDLLLTFLWRQWTALGVMGVSGTEDKWIIDPEALLIFSLELARYDPRLFDEILAWLEVNGEWLDTARLRRLLANQDPPVVRLVGAALRHVAVRGQERKWKNLVEFCRNRKPLKDGLLEPLFKSPAGDFHPRAEGESIEPGFMAFDLNRPRIKIQKKAGEVRPDSGSNARFLMRSLFGIGAKSEVLLYLLTHNEGRSKEIADSVGLLWLSVHQALIDVSKSGLVLKKPHGKKVEYWLSKPKWWSLLASADHQHASEPEWLNWAAVFGGFSSIWRTVDELGTTAPSEYMRGSKLMDIQASVDTVAREFARAGYDLGDVPSAGLPLELYQRMLLKFLGAVFDLRMKEKESAPSR